MLVYILGAASSYTLTLKCVILDLIQNPVTNNHLSKNKAIGWQQ